MPRASCADPPGLSPGAGVAAMSHIAIPQSLDSKNVN